MLWALAMGGLFIGCLVLYNANKTEEGGSKAVFAVFAMIAVVSLVAVFFLVRVFRPSGYVDF